MKWVRLRRDARCAFGCDVAPRAQVLERTHGRRRFGPRFVVCVACAFKHYAMVPPAAVEELARDGKAAALGNDE